MIVPFVLMLISLLGVGVALTLPAFGDFLLLAGPCAVASLILLMRAGFAQVPAAPQRAPIPRPLSRYMPSWKKPRRFLVIDGSNVMHWKDGVPQLDTLREVVQHLSSLGFSPGVVFDATAGHLVAGKYQHHFAMGQHLGLPEDRIMVVDKGTPADPIILAAARDLRAPIVSNDKYRDWADDFPEVHDPGHLIKGGYRDGKLWLDLETTAPPRNKQTRLAAKP